MGDDVWAFAAAVSFAILPGVGWIGRGAGLGRLGWLGLVCAVSVGLNSYAAMLLSMAGWYSPPVSRWWCLALVFLTAAGWFLRRRGFIPSANAEGAAKPDGGDRWNWGSVLICPILLLVGYKSVFLPFYSWDAIASWNRWARNFLVVPDYFHTERFFYPLYMSWGMSFPYMVSGDPTQEFAAHSLSFVHVLILFGGVALLSRPLKIPAPLVFSGCFSSAVLTTVAATGYADVGSTAFAACSAGLFLNSVTDENRDWGFWAGLAAGTSALFKQSSLVVLGVLPLFILLFSDRAQWRRTIVQSLKLGAGFLLVTLPWALSRQTELVGNQLLYVTRDIHGGASAWTVLGKGLKMLLEGSSTLALPGVDWAVLVLTGVLFLLGVVVSRPGRALGASALVLLAVWINTANYDTRAAMAAIPLIAAVATLGLVWLANRGLSAKSRNALILTLIALNVTLFAVGELAGNQVWGGYRVADWKAGILWRQVRPLAGREEKLSRLVSGYKDLATWRRNAGDFQGRVWTDPVLRATVFPEVYDGGGRWTGVLPGHWQAQQGDVILLQPVELRRSIAGINKTWEEWLAELAEQGVVRREEPIGSLAVYTVLSKRPDPDNQ